MASINITHKRLALAGLAAVLSASLFAILHASPTLPVSHQHSATANAQAIDGESADQAPAVSVKIVSCEKLADIPGKSITTTIVTFPPGAHSPRHRHPGTVTAFVLKGAVRSQLAGRPAETFTIGQTWFEPPGTIHLFAENASLTDTAELLAIFVADDNCGPLTIRD